MFTVWGRLRGGGGLGGGGRGRRGGGRRGGGGGRRGGGRRGGGGWRQYRWTGLSYYCNYSHTTCLSIRSEPDWRWTSEWHCIMTGYFYFLCRNVS